MRYDPLKSPSDSDWLARDESEKISLVLDHHADAGEPIPESGLHFHAVVHVVVENQIAMGEEIPVAATLKRLMSEGLNRHDAIHAIGSVLAVRIYEVLNSASGGTPGSVNEEYFNELESLTAKEWLESHSS